MARPKCHIRIAVIGGSECSAEESRIAEELGFKISQSGFTLITGGLGGVMEAASRGAKKAKGLTVGVLPGEDPAEANPYVDLPIVTGLGDARNVIVVTSADVVIAVGGKFGTLSEIALALKKHKPVIGIGTWNLDDDRIKGGKFIKVNTPTEAIEVMLRLLRNHGLSP